MYFNHAIILRSRSIPDFELWGTFIVPVSTKKCPSLPIESHHGNKDMIIDLSKIFVRYAPHARIQRGSGRPDPPPLNIPISLNYKIKLPKNMSQSPPLLYLMQSTIISLYIFVVILYIYIKLCQKGDNSECQPLQIVPHNTEIIITKKR